MVVNTLQQTNMTTGEVAPVFFGRNDVTNYLNAAKRLRNYIVTPQGSWRARGGTKFVNEVKDSSKQVRLIPFIRTIPTICNVVEFGDGYIRFIKDGVQVKNDVGQIAEAGYLNHANTRTASSVTRSGTTVTVTTSAVHPYTTGNKIVIHGATPDDYNGSHDIVVVSTTVFRYEITSTTAATPATGTIKTLPTTTPYTEAYAQQLDYAQSADIMFLAQGNVSPKKLQRYGAFYWVLEDLDPKDGPYLDQNSTTTTMTPSATTGSGINITASAATFTSADVGRIVRIRHKDTTVTPNIFTWGSAKITGFTSTTVVVATVQTGHEFFSTGSNKNWRLSTWSDARGWPKLVKFHQQRLVFANTSTQPDTFWMSQTNNFDTFSPTIPAVGDPSSVSVTEGISGATATKSVTKNVDGDLGDHVVTPECSITYTVVSKDVNQIQWMSSDRGLIIGTQSGEYVITSQGGKGLTPEDIQAQAYTKEGSNSSTTVTAKNAMLFIDRSGTKINQFRFSIGSDGYESSEITLLSQHLSSPGIVSMAYTNLPFGVLWFSNADGLLIGCTYLPDQKVISFHSHSIGGDGEGQDGVVESITAVPSPDGLTDHLYMVVKRTISTIGVKRYIEYMSPVVDVDTSEANHKNQLLFLDSAVIINSSGSPFTVSSSAQFYHIRNSVMTYVADGKTISTVTVASDGNITIPEAAEYLSGGFNYESVYESLPITVSNNQYSSNSTRKRVIHISPRFDRTNTGKYGNNEDNLRDFNFRTASDLMDDSPPLFTGMKRQKFTIGNRREQSIIIKRTEPYPQHILALEYDLAMVSK